jgi:hypothetical protein
MVLIVKKELMMYSMRPEPPVAAPNRPEQQIRIHFTAFRKEAYNSLSLALSFALVLLISFPFVFRIVFVATAVLPVYLSPIMNSR